MKYTFRGGFHVEEHKNTADKPILRIPPPAQVCIPLLQHIGVPCEARVAVGDRVLRGQMIGEVVNGLGCPVHSSVSGTVSAIRKQRSATGVEVTQVVIDNDFLDETVPTIGLTDRKVGDLTVEEMIELIRLAGIAGMGGATFPTHAKIRSAFGRVDTLIVNAAECEPYITANHRLVLEEPEAVLGGARVLARVFGLSQSVIAIEDNKANAVKVLEGLTEDTPDICVRVVKTKYPQGDERQLIYALLRREIPAGKLPADVGCVIFNAETVAAVWRAFSLNKPLYERIVTVDGDCVKEPGNFLVPIGTPFSALIQACGGLIAPPARLISGGPMMGFAQWDVESPVTKGTSALLVLSEETGAVVGAAECIRCGRCVKSCPMHLMPNYIAAFARRGNYDRAEEFGARSCVECGTCSYVCPARVPIVQHVRVAKFNLNARHRVGT